MTRKKKVAVQSEPVDKMDHFIRKNYKKILFSAGAVVFAFIVVYGGMSFMNSQDQNKVNAMGDIEMVSFASVADVDKFVEKSTSLGFVKDYILLRASGMYAFFGADDKALIYLDQVGGQYAEFARSLKFDLGKGTIDSNDLSSGALSELWHYRNVLSKNEGERATAITAFEKAWPTSQLLAKIKQWGLK